jgi:HEAT repeat protein
VSKQCAVLYSRYFSFLLAFLLSPSLCIVTAKKFSVSAQPTKELSQQTSEDNSGLKILDQKNDGNVANFVSILKNRQEKPILRLAAVRALNFFRHRNPTVVQALNEVLNDRREDSNLRSEVAYVLEIVAQNNSNTIQILTDILQNSNEAYNLRITAAYALGSMKQGNAAAVKALNKLVRNR